MEYNQIHDTSLVLWRVQRWVGYGAYLYGVYKKKKIRKLNQSSK